MKKILKKLTNNFGLKLLSVFFAVILWLVVVNIDDPQLTTKFTIPITIENEVYLTNLGKYYEVVDDMNTITISVTGKRNTIEKLSASDFRAVANMKNIEDNSRVKIEVSALRSVSSLTITQKEDYMNVTVGELATKRFVVAAKTTGTPAEGAAVGTISLNRNLLKISGPEEIVNSVDSAAITINVDGFSTQITDEMIPELYDVDGNRVDSTDLTMNIQTIEVTVSMLEVKTVPLSFQVSGTLPDGYEYVNTEFSPDSVKVKGEASILNTINTITIPGEVLDLTGATENIKKTVDISTYLPEGISLVNTEDAKITVTVNIDESETRTYDMPTANITVNNIPDNYKIQFAATTVKLSITGFSSVLDAIDANAITGSIDVSGLAPGTNSVALNIESKENYTIAATNVVVYVTDELLEEENNTNGSAQNGISDTENGTGNEGSNTGTGQNDGETGAAGEGEDTTEGGTTQDSTTPDDSESSQKKDDTDN